MPLLDDRVTKQVRSALAGLQQPVRLVMFTQADGGALECQYCSETRQLVQEVGGLSDRLSVDVKDFQTDEALARQYGVDKIPAVVLLADGDPPVDNGIRFFGLPAGYEFSSLLEDLRMLGGAGHGLGAETLQAISSLKEPVHIQVFVTPT